MKTSAFLSLTLAACDVVPNSQYSVANSCNPLPNVGVGCFGPGSFNCEFQMGVLCQ